MKKLFAAFIFLTSLISYSQKTIVEDVFDKENRPVSFHVLPNFNQIIIESGKIPGMSWKRSIKTVTRYDDDGTKKVLLQSGDQMDLEVNYVDNNVFKACEFASMKWSTDFKIYVDKDVSQLISKDIEHSYFNNLYLFDLGNEKQKSVYNLFDDDLYLFKTNIKTLKSDKIKLDIPFKNVNYKEFFKLKKLAYKAVYNLNNFEIVLKFIDLNCNSTVVNRLIYDYNGKFITKKSYKIDIENALVESNNKGGIIISNGGNGGVSSDKLAFNQINEFNVIDTMLGFADQLSVNNFIVDNKQNVYFYGLFGEKGDKSIDGTPRGYYVFKFDKEGKLLWKKLEDIVKKDFNKYASTANLYVTLLNRGSKLDFVIFSSRFEDMLIYKEINIESGELTNSKDIAIDESSVSVAGIQDDFLLAFFNLKDWKKVRCNPMTLVYYETIPKFKTYIDTFQSKKEKTYINSYAFEKGIWLIESDNKTYYKVSYFDN